LLSASAQQLAELQKADIVEDAIALDYWNKTLSGEDLPESVQASYYSANALTFLGIPPLLGRVFTASDGPPGKESGGVVVLTHRFWQSRYGSQPNVVGKTIDLNREPYTVIGVVPPRFDNYLGDVIVPIHLKFDPGFAWGVQARLKPGVSRSTAELS